MVKFLKASYAERVIFIVFLNFFSYGYGVSVKANTLSQDLILRNLQLKFQYRTNFIYFCLKNT